MEVLELDGKKYVKASSIARELGYTADYVGQLCRSGKVDAHLVGRSWYVSEESIRSHKDSRHRSSRTKTKEAFKVTLRKETEAHSEARPTATNATGPRLHHFYSKLTPKAVKYNEDESELIPILKEKSSHTDADIAVEPAGAQAVPIRKESESYRLEASERPEIKFKGDLDIEAVEAPDEAQESTPAQKHMPKEEVEEDTDTSNESQSTSQPTLQKRTDPATTGQRMRVTDMNDIRSSQIPLRSGGVVAMTRDDQADAGDVRELAIQRVVAAPRTSSRAAFAYISTSVLVAVILALGFLFVEEAVVVRSDGAGTDTQYGLNLSNAIKALERFK